jgi:hypothetical protein
MCVCQSILHLGQNTTLCILSSGGKCLTCFFLTITLNNSYSHVNPFKRKDKILILKHNGPLLYFAMNGLAEIVENISRDNLL